MEPLILQDMKKIEERNQNNLIIVSQNIPYESTANSRDSDEE